MLQPMKIRPVLDHGYVRLVDKLGSDLTTVNSARVSYDKQVNEITTRDERLIDFLAKHGHTSPFRHSILQFEVFAPLMIARQWWKYVVGSDHIMDAWNESSRRYVTEEPIFYIPAYDEWRSAPENKKQGSGDWIPVQVGKGLSYMLKEHIMQSIALYENAMSEDNVCAEQARLFLPAYSMYVRWYWTASLQSVAHLVNQRSKSDAQHEFQQYARVVSEMTLEEFPHSFKALIESEE